MNWTELPTYYWIIFILLLVGINFFRLKTFKRVADSRKKYKDLTPQKLNDLTFLKECIAQEPALVEMKKQLDKIVEHKVDFIPVYGYRMKRGVLTTTIYNYMFGFNPESPGFLIVQINKEGMPLDYPYLIDDSRADSLKFMLDGSLKITFPDGESIAVIISPFMAEESDSLGLIDVSQTEIVMSFKEFLKSNYSI